MDREMESRSEARTSQSSNWRILVVDDEEADRVSIQRVLEARGHEVVTAENGTQALELAASFHPNLIFLDIHLPDLQGQDVCARMRAKPWGRLLAIYAITGADRFETMARARGVGFDGFLSKPIDAEVVARLLPDR